MATFHMSEAELLRDPSRLLAHVKSGEEVVIDGETAPIATVHPPEDRRKGRTLSETIAILDAIEKERGHPLRMGKEFADDLEEIIANRKPLRPAWD